jgi:hypothetical protein
MLAAQTVCHFTGDTTENFVCSVNHEPFTLHLMGFCGKRFHDIFHQIVSPLSVSSIAFGLAYICTLSFESINTVLPFPRDYIEESMIVAKKSPEVNSGL